MVIKETHNTQIYIYAKSQTHTNMYTNQMTDEQTHTHTQIQTHKHTQIHTCTYIHTHICIHIHTHTRTDTYHFTIGTLN